MIYCGTEVRAMRCFTRRSELNNRRRIPPSDDYSGEFLKSACLPESWARLTVCGASDLSDGVPRRQL
jgi:hypothetical protein